MARRSAACPRCSGWGGAHYHWCTEVGGPGHKPSAAPVIAAPEGEPTDTLPEPASLSAPAGLNPAPEVVATSPVVAPPVRAFRRPSLMQELRPKPEPEYPRTEARRIVKLIDQVAEPTPREQWRVIAGEARVDWEKVDDDQLGAVAHSLAAFCRTHGLPITYKIKEDVLALEGFDESEIHSALTHPDRVDVRPESWHRDKRYPVLSFRRGDVNVILGLREVDAPAVIAAYWTSLLAGYDPTSHRDRTGGGGAKLTGGLPTTPKALVKRLTMMGAAIDPEWSMTTEPIEVSYDGQSLGKIPTSPRTPKAEVETAWQRCQRRILAIDQRAASVAGHRA